MDYAIRLIAFLFVSLSVHLVVLLIEQNNRSDYSVVPQHGVEYLSRSAAQFLLPQDDQPMAEQNVSPDGRGNSQAIPRMSVPRRTELQQPDVPKPILKAKTDPSKHKKVEVISAPQIPEQEETISAAVKFVEKKTVVSSTVEGNAASETGASGSQAVERIASGGGSVRQSPAGDENSVSFQKALPRYNLNPLTYPESALRRRQQGTVQLEVLVKQDGSVGDIKLLVSSGYKSLDRAAINAVKHWQFEPALSFGNVVESRVVVPVDFVLSGK